MVKLSLTRLEPWQDPKVRPYIDIRHVTKSFGNVQALDGVSLSVYQNEFFSLLGGSGCGKTTLLRILAGFEAPTSGRILIDGVDVTDMPPFERPLNMMFQSYALFPHMTVEENVAFGLRQEKIPEPTLKKRVKEMLSLVHMSAFAHRKPPLLSGGQKQRVALARALAKRPKVLLLDEPLAALDRILREDTQFELVNIQEELGLTFIMVTHDQEEAMTVSTRMGIMDHGRICQVGTPGEVYEYPNSVFVAGFVGAINLFEGLVIEHEADHLLVRSEDLDTDLYVSHTSSLPVGAQVSVGIRPEKIMMSVRERQSDRNAVKGQVEDIAYLGDVSIYHVRLPSGKIVLATQPNVGRLRERVVQWDDVVSLFWKPENGVVLTA
ncbi:polyamine ABC transporter ATP-binding protein [bacterium NHP-B]|nr:polyamine ABC transporter ATP-binding protein [bacterium NHP-B]